MSEQAKAFINFATTTERLADQTKTISYGPARTSSGKLVWKHASSEIDIRPHLPTFDPNFEVGIAKDHEWYAHTRPRLEKQFKRWLEE